MLAHLFTRIYFDDESSNAEDPVLAPTPSDRRATLVATGSQAGSTRVHRFEIRMQEGASGEAETVFLAAWRASRQRAY